MTHTVLEGPGSLRGETPIQIIQRAEGGLALKKVLVFAAQITEDENLGEIN